MDRVSARLDWDRGLWFRYHDAWDIHEEEGDASEGVCLRFTVDSSYWCGSCAHADDQAAAAAGPMAIAARFLTWENLPWITFAPGGWIIDLTALKERFRDLHKHKWFNGRVRVVPLSSSGGKPDDDVTFDAHFTPQSVKENRMPIYDVPTEISASLERFRARYPDPSKVAFIMMRFGSTPAHHAITEAVRQAFHASGLVAVRADDRDYHDQLFFNILTYIYGSGMGVAVIERLEADDFNPNVSLEVGYMLALGKPVCLLKDKTLRTLQADLVGHLYKPFDTQDPSTSIPPLISKWLSDRFV